MVIVTKTQIKYRSKLLTEDRARRFAACMEANHRFTDVEIHENPRAKNWYQRHYVSFAPANPMRQAELLAGQQECRAERAAAEGTAYVFVLDRDSIQPFCWVFNPQSGETYEVTLQDCSCPDFRYRCHGVGMACKHMLALSAAVERGEVGHW